MSREIKFRAWEGNQGYYLPDDYSLMVVLKESLNTEYSNVIVEQYTNLKDVCGVDIYENDIIEISDTSYGDNDKHCGVVEYSDYAELVVGNILLSRIYKTIKVIGNIHENQNLLEEKWQWKKQ